MLYTYKRAWRMRALIYLFLAAALGFLAMGVIGLFTGNPAGIILGFLLSSLLALSVWGMHLYFRNIAVALRRDGDLLVVDTWTLKGRNSEIFPFAAARISEEVHMEADDGDIDEGISVESRFRRLFVEGRKRPYVVDMLGHEDAGALLAATFPARAPADR